MYCEYSDITASIPEAQIASLTDDTNGETVDEDIVNQAISSADELIDSYLRSRYGVPLTTVPLIIKELSVELAIYNLYKRRFRTDIPEPIQENFKIQISILKQIQNGTMNLGIEKKALDGGQVGIYRTNKKAIDKTFNREMWDRF